MSASIVAAFLSVCSIIFSSILHGFRLKISWIRNAHILWLILPPILFVTGSFALTLLITGLAITCCLLSQNASLIAPLYIATLAVIPDYVKFELPFPGLRYLLNVNLPLLWSILLIPLFIRWGYRILGKLNFVDITLVCYVMFVSLLDLRATTFTDGLRHAVESILTILIPYFIITRAITNLDNFYNILNALLTMGIIFCCISLFSVAKQWNFFELYSPDAFADIRYGFVRIGGAVSTVVNGLVCGLALLLLLGKILKHNLSKLSVLILSAGLPLTILMTFSRGVWLASFILVLFYLLLKTGIKKSSIFLLLISLCITFFLILFSYSLSDDFGTFEFRQQLYKASLEQFSNSPLFGDANFLEIPPINDLPRGTGGIIDIVSVYLQILLEYGLIGLILYLTSFFLLIFKLSVARDRLLKNDPLRKSVSFLIAALLSYLVFISTTSKVSLVGSLGWILIASSQGLLFVIKKGNEHVKEI